MRWIVAFAACAGLVACGNQAQSPRRVPQSADQPRVARAQESQLQFAEPPVVIAHGGGGVEAWVRLNRPLRDNEGALHEHPGSRAEIEIRGTSPDFPGLDRDDLHPTCYRQDLDGDLAAGEQVTVALVLGASERITATADVEKSPATADAERRVLKRLRCPTDGGATRRCDWTKLVPARYMAISAWSGTNASCRMARAVMESVGRWADSGRCFRALCVRAHRNNRGFRCSVDQVGEADWQITCVRGERIVRGYTAD
jgi:hypothetical protein